MYKTVLQKIETKEKELDAKEKEADNFPIEDVTDVLNDIRKQRIKIHTVKAIMKKDIIPDKFDSSKISVDMFNKQTTTPIVAKLLCKSLKENINEIF